MIDKLGLDGLGGASVRVEPTPQELLGVSEGTATPAVVGLEPVAWYLENEDEYMSEKLRKEHERLNSYTFKLCKVAHPLYSAATVEQLVQERGDCRALVQSLYEVLGQKKDQLAAMTQELDELREWNKAMVVKAASGGVLDGYREMGKQLAASQAENEALRKDAERWRFFRIADWADWNAVFRVDHDGLSLPELLDKATDAAMKGE